VTLDALDRPKRPLAKVNKNSLVPAERCVVVNADAISEENVWQRENCKVVDFSDPTQV